MSSRRTHVRESSPHVLPLDGRNATRLVAPLVIVLVTQVPLLQLLLFMKCMYLPCTPWRRRSSTISRADRSSLEELGHSR